MTILFKMEKVSLVVLRKDNRILLYLRDNKQGIPYPNYWSLIGGTVEKNETPLHAIKREIKEEINSEVKNIKFVEKIKVINNPLCENHIISLFKGEISKNLEDINLSEGQKVSYFTLSELKKVYVVDFLKKFIFQNKEKFSLNKNKKLK